MSTKHTSAEDSRAIVAAVGRRLDESTSVLVDELTVYLGERIPELRDDSRLRELLRASIAANLTTVCHMLINEISVETTKAPAAALEYALRHAQNDMPGSSLVRAYMVGQALLLQRAMDLVREQGVGAEREQQAITVINFTVHAYTDRVLQTLIDAHEQERRQWLNTRARVRRDVVAEFLRGNSTRGEVIRDADFEHETDYSLGGNHVAFLAWLPDRDTTGEVAIETQARRVAAALAPGDNALVVIADAVMAWGWVHVRNSDINRDALTEVVAGMKPLRVAVGSAAYGSDGFRQTHLQAQDAHLVAIRSPRMSDQATVTYRDAGVGVAALLLRDVSSSRRWVHDKLGALAAPTATARAMRETLVSFVENGQSFARTAEALGVHRNTVMSRIERFVDSREPHTQDLSEISLAVRMLDFLPADERG